MTALNPMRNDVFADVDAATVATILQLQLEDLNEIENARPGKRKADDVLADDELAHSIMMEEVRAYQRQLMDERMARSIADAVSADAENLQRHTQEEIALRRDNDLARTLIGQQPQNGPGITRAEENQEAIETLTAYNYHRHAPQTVIDLTVDDTDQDVEVIPAVADTGAMQVSRPCISCTEEKAESGLVRTACGHDYCQRCLVYVFESSFSDESLFPPRCCRQPVLLENTGTFLTNRQKARYEEKAVEFRSSDRTYCCQATCSRFMKPENTVGTIAICPSCSTMTCIKCKLGAHGVADCPNDTYAATLRELVQLNGWRACNNCRRVVELTTGCNHITCKCRHEFCYECGARWKTCQCRQWDENRLVERANRVAEREARVARIVDGPAVRAERVHAAAARLRVNHACAHAAFTREKRPDECQMCHDYYQRFLWVCDGCAIRICATCRYNRL